MVTHSVKFIKGREEEMLFYPGETEWVFDDRAIVS